MDEDESGENKVIEMTTSNRPVKMEIAVTGSARDAEYQSEMTLAVALPAKPAITFCHRARYLIIHKTSTAGRGPELPPRIGSE